MKQQLHTLLKAFKIAGEPLYSRGIDSCDGDFAIHCCVEDTKEKQNFYIFHRLNQNLDNPKAALYNTGRITRHIHWKQLRQKQITEASCPKLLYTHSGLFHHQCSDGHTWQCLSTSPAPSAQHPISHSEHCFTIAKTFGNFVALLDDVHPSTLLEPVDHFRDCHHQVLAMAEAATNDPMGRARRVQHQVQQVFQYLPFCKGLDKKIVSSEIPQRAVHHDARSENLIICSHPDCPPCVIGLDYCMPGSALYDFGSIVFHSLLSSGQALPLKSTITTLDKKYIEACTKGFLSGCQCLSQDEIRSLSFGPVAYAIDTVARLLHDFITLPRNEEGNRIDPIIGRIHDSIPLLQLLASYQDELTESLDTIASSSTATSHTPRPLGARTIF